MQLLVDIGNTRIKWALLSEELAPYTSAEYSQKNLDTFFNEIWNALQKPTHVYVASVASQEINHHLEKWVTQNWQIPVKFMQSQATALGVTNGYEHPQELGIDRWLGMLAAYHLTEHQNVCVFDCGSAITADVITASGQHLGGLIFPGVFLLKNSLIKNTEKLAKIDINKSPIKNKLLGINTTECLTQGCLYGAAAFIQSLERDLKKELQLDLTIIMTGGDSILHLLSLLPSHYHYYSALVLQGLNLLVKDLN